MTASVEWAHGEAGVKLIQIPLFDDTEFEGDGTFPIHLHDLTGGAEYALTSATVTLRDNETVPPCEDGDFQICLLDRFLLETRWARLNGESGDGRVAQPTNSSAAFEFFEEGNVEIVVKLKDACALPQGDPLRGFWVFVAGLTNVRVELTLVDTESGLVRRFYNALERPFFTVAHDSPDGHLNPPGAIQATTEALGAFPTCDL